MAEKLSTSSVTIGSSSFTPLPRFRVLFVITLSVVALTAAVSPNFRLDTGVRSTPLGSDFLQEYTGGYIWASEFRSELYQLEHFREIQHDRRVVGFSWSGDHYYPMVYPPFYYMLLSPLAALPYWASMLIWLFLIQLSMTLVIGLWTHFYPPAHNFTWRSTFAMLAFYPVLMSVNTGHKSVFLLAILTGTFLLLFRRKPLVAGICFGLIAFKPHLAIVIGLAMLLKRQWRFIAGCSITLLVLFGLSLTAGPDLCVDYFFQCMNAADYSDHAGYQLHESHNLIGAISLFFGNDTWARQLALILAFATVVVGVALAMRGEIVYSEPRFGMQFSILVIATVLLSPHFYTYDLTILLLPMGLLFCNVPKMAESDLTVKFLMWLGVLFFVFVGMSASIAEVTSIQITLPIFIGTLMLLASILAQPPRKSEDQFVLATR